MDTRRSGALVAGASGALLVASLFLPWFGLDVGVVLPGGGGSVTVEQESLSGWEAFGVIDLVLFVSAAAALVLAGREAWPRLASNPILPTAVTIAGALCALLIVFRLLVPPEFVVPPGVDGSGVGRRLGAFFGLLAAAGMAWGAQLGLSEASEPAPGVAAPGPADRTPAEPGSAERVPAQPEAAQPEAAQREAAQPASEADAFQDRATIHALRDGGILDVPTGRGVYAVLRSPDSPPAFLDRNPGAPVKDRDPSVSRSALEANWVEGAEIVYLGRASALRRRLRELLRFGAGSPVSSWGGRLIWQLEDAERLVLAWRLTGDEEPKEVEKSLMAEFRERHGQPPFANDPHRMGG